MTRIVKLHEPDADEDVVRELETALKLAKAGKLRSVVIAGSLNASRTFTTWATTDVMPLIGEIEFLKHQLMNALVPKPCDDDDPD